MLLEDLVERLIAAVKLDPNIEQNARDVRAKYGPMFTAEGISNLDPEKFRAFLTYKENKHWTGLQQVSAKLTADLPLLKRALSVLVDTSKSISSRIDEAREIVQGLGKARISAILVVAFPDDFGVYNSASDAALEKIGVHPRSNHPKFDSLTTGDQYVLFNQVLSELRAKYDISYWSLDWVMGQLADDESPGSLRASDPASASVAEIAPVDDVADGRFGLERHLEDFLVENWDRTQLQQRLEILVDKDGEIIGKQYRTSVGPIDLLCRHKDGSGYTVIELKKRQTNDDTVGQIARYMGWIKKNLAAAGQVVRGIIICPDADEKLMIALEVVPNVDVYVYEVMFSLSKKG